MVAIHDKRENNSLELFYYDQQRIKHFMELCYKVRRNSCGYANKF